MCFCIARYQGTAHDDAPGKHLGRNPASDNTKSSRAVSGTVASISRYSILHYFALVSGSQGRHDWQSLAKDSRMAPNGCLRTDDVSTWQIQLSVRSQGKAEECLSSAFASVDVRTSNLTPCSAWRGAAHAAPRLLVRCLRSSVKLLVALHPAAQPCSLQHELLIETTRRLRVFSRGLFSPPKNHGKTIDPLSTLRTHLLMSIMVNFTHAQLCQFP